jgi:hypothetical protein
MGERSQVRALGFMVDRFHKSVAAPIAPTGRLMIAQGNALGKMVGKDQALKGRPNRLWLARPFRAGSIQTELPRALPWAALDRPFGAQTCPTKRLKFN